jgi:CubicO group peptidase (beta-lactamase class C family)
LFCKECEIVGNRESGEQHSHVFIRAHFSVARCLLETIAMRLTVVLVLLTAVLSSGCAASNGQSLSFVPDRMAHYHVPGLSLAFIHNSSVKSVQSYGVVRVGGAPVTPETLFQASSISMPITAAAVLRLAEQHKLDLDADVNQYLKNWKIPANRFTDQKKVTLRELLSHTAGATVHGFGGYAAGQPVPTLIQVLNGERPAHSAPIRIDAVPGSRFRYAGGNYVIIQQILIDVTGEPFPDLMQQLVLQPLGMVHSTFQQPLPTNLRQQAATPYDADGKPIEGGPHTHPEMAVAGLWTTPSDIALFALGIQNALAGKSGALLSPSTAHEMLQRVQGFYSLGFAIAGDGPNRYFSHPGVNLGFVAFLFAYEKGDGLVLMTNGQNSKALGLEIIRAFANQYGWTEYPTDDSSLIWVIYLIGGGLVLVAYLLFRAKRSKRRELPGGHTTEVVP